jgi:predicted ATP-grasp superfamily ATP-dependent carboligase
MRNKENDFPSVVITGLCETMSLYLTRSLGRRGIPIIATDSNISSHYGKSKYCQRLYCKSLYDSSLIDLLCELGKSFEKKAVLFNCTDQSVLNVSKEREKLQPYYHFVLPPHATIEKLMSKKLFYNFALENDFLVPRTFFSHTYDEIEMVSKKISYPCIIKPEFRDKNWRENVPLKVLYVESKENLLRLTEKHKIQESSLVIQEWIEGDDKDLYFCLVYISRHHEPMAVLTGRKLRQHPHLAGTLSVAESIWVPEVVNESLRLLEKEGCVGFCSVEFKQSKKDGKFYIMEPTMGRPDSQEEICATAGLDIPYIAYLDAIGQDTTPLGDFEEGVKWIDLERSYYTVREYFMGTLTLRELLSIYRGKRSYSLWAMDDPLPAVFFLKGKLLKGINKFLH